LIAKRIKTIYDIEEDLFRGSFYLAKGKAFEKGGIFQTKWCKCGPQFYTFGHEQMNLKRFYQMIYKNKLSGVIVVQNFNYFKNIHMYLELLSFQ
jgi:hypothetical protein